MVYCVPVSNGGDPGRQLRLERKFSKLLVNAQKNILAQLFPLFVFLYQPADHVSHQLFVLPDQKPESLHIASQYILYQDPVINH
jgi:hypothetical protein